MPTTGEDSETAAMTGFEKRVHSALRQNAPIQLTGGDNKDRLAFIDEQVTDPVIIVDCCDAEDYLTVAKHTCDGLTDTFDDVEISYSDDGDENSLRALNLWFDIEQTSEKHDFTIVFSEFDSLDSETRVSIAQKLKGLYEGTDIQLFITADDRGALFVANGDLSGRVLTKSLDER